MTTRHDTAVSNTLSWAQASADAGDYRDALTWIRTLEAIGEALPPAYQAKRESWTSALAADRLIETQGDSSYG